MKPPSRRRAEPSRFRPRSTEEKQAVTVRSFCKGWTRNEQQSFLKGLKQQQNYDLELDLTELQKKVPLRSLQEIEDLIKILKSRVVQRVFLQVQTQRREEHKSKVPIEVWGELVQKVTGSHEKTLSSAFSQMLVIAGTEPCSLLYSVPPQDIAIQTPTRSSHPVPIMPKPNAQLWFSPQSTIPAVTVLPSQTDSTSQSLPSDVSSKTIASTSSAGSLLIQPDSSSNAVEHANKLQLDKSSVSSSQEPSTPKKSTQLGESSQMTSPTQLESAPEATASSLSAISTGSVSPSVSLPSNKHNPAQSEMSDQDPLHRPKVLKCIVNFDKIYEFMSDPDSKSCKSALTSMECAVLLDLLMSLPEELPLLDCKELQHHLLQVHKKLSNPTVMPATCPETVSNIPPADGVNSAKFTKQQTMAAGSCTRPEDPSSDSSVTEPVKDKADWASVGMCPLNPLMIPLALLKRQSNKDSNK